MSEPISPHRPPRPKEWQRRLDRLAGDLNVVLFVFAVGLAVLDVTVFVADIAVAQIPATRAAPAALVVPATAPDTQPALNRLVSGSG